MIKCTDSDELQSYKPGLVGHIRLGLVGKVCVCIYFHSPRMVLPVHS